MIPIGLANAQYPHGNLSYIPTTYKKQNDIYFFFSIDTNKENKIRLLFKIKKFYSSVRTKTNN